MIHFEAKVDTGAQANIMPIRVYDKLVRIRRNLKPLTARLQEHSGQIPQNLIQFAKEVKTIDGVTRFKQVGDHDPELLELVSKCSVWKANCLVRTEKLCTDGFGSNENSILMIQMVLKGGLLLAKNVGYGNEFYTDRDSWS